MDYNIAGFPANMVAQSVTIPAGTAVSEMIATQGMSLVGLIMPAAWTAANIAFAVCVTGNANDLQQVYSNGGQPEYAVVAASHPVAFPTPDALKFPFLQILSVAGPTDNVTPVNQVAAAKLILVFSKYLS